MESTLERSFLYYWRLLAPDAPEPVQEFAFCPGRKYRADFAFPDKKLLIELEGGIHNNGRHTRPRGYSMDCEKYNQATILGWRILRYTSIMMKNDPQTMISQILQALGEGLDGN